MSVRTRVGYSVCWVCARGRTGRKMVFVGEISTKNSHKYGCGYCRSSSVQMVLRFKFELMRVMSVRVSTQTRTFHFALEYVYIYAWNLVDLLCCAVAHLILPACVCSVSHTHTLGTLGILGAQGFGPSEFNSTRFNVASIFMCVRVCCQSSSGGAAPA